jgi:predicted PhzF superfamily epimerase YddE/YHI9
VAFAWVDAFADGPFTGNPAAVCLLEAPWDGPAGETRMAALAAEFGISETAYVAPGPGGVWSLRWFSPTTEIDLCGHATLASAHVLRDEGRAASGDTVSFATRSGLLRARLEDAAVELDLPADPPAPVEPPPSLAGLPGARGFARAEGSLLVELDSAQAVAGFRPDLEALSRAHPKAVLVTAPGPGAEADYVLRLFGPNLGIPEDPVTGSAACVAGPYWAARLGSNRLSSRQLSARGGRLEVSVAGDRVGVGGRAVTVAAGRLALAGP